MVQFLADIAGMLEVLAVAAGLLVLHRGRVEQAGLIKLAGLVLIVGGIAGGGCTGYYWVKYQQNGDFETAYPHHGMDMGKMMDHMQQMMGDGGMQGMMDDGGNGSSGDHQEHHPDQ